MQRSLLLLLLLLMGQSSFFVCQVHEYHFINEKKTWDDASAYCKQMHTNLATVPNAEFTTKLSQTGPGQEEAWIGMQTNESGVQWQWSLPGVKFDRDMWDIGEPNYVHEGKPEKCAIMLSTTKKWADVSCSKTHQFICYDETNQTGTRFPWVSSPKTWLEAQKHCRKKHTDLVSGLKQLNALKDEDWRDKSEKVWIGLFRNPWTWSDGSNISYTNWKNDKEANPAASGKPLCVAVEKSSRKWKSEKCDKTKPFFCYTDRTQVMQEKLSWDDAIDHCRKKKMNLVSITSCDDMAWIEERAKEATTRYIWLGLRYSCPLDLWFWINDRALRVSNWAPAQPKQQCDTAVAMDKEKEYMWVRKSDVEKYNFICSK